MINFLKESTFRVKEVFWKSWDVLWSRYFSIAGLCLSLFITSNTSGILAFYLQNVNPLLSAFMAMLFAVAYFGIQLTLFKFIFLLLDQEEDITLSRTIPSTLELTRFFLAMLSVGGLLLLTYLAASLLAWPLIYWVGIDVVLRGIYITSAILMFYFLLRIAFFPFFIIDKRARAWEAIRLSIALTRGNVTKLLLIMAFFAILHLLYIYFNYLGYAMVSTVVSILSSFFVVPLSSVVIAVAYRDMVKGARADGKQYPVNGQIGS